MVRTWDLLQSYRFPKNFGIQGRLYFKRGGILNLKNERIRALRIQIEAMKKANNPNQKKIERLQELLEQEIDFDNLLGGY